MFAAKQSGQDLASGLFKKCRLTPEPRGEDQGSPRTGEWGRTLTVNEDRSRAVQAASGAFSTANKKASSAPEALYLLAFLGSLLAAHYAGSTAKADDAPAATPSGTDLGADSEMTAPVLVGTGCPDGSYTVSAVTGEPLRISFMNFIVTADDTTHRERKNCEARLHINVPAGFRVGFEKAAVTGDAALAATGRGSVSLRAFAAGTSNGAALLTLGTGAVQPVALERSVPEMEWFGCAESPDLVLQIDAVAKQTPPSPVASNADGDGSTDNSNSPAVGVSVVKISDLAMPALKYERCAAQVTRS